MFDDTMALMMIMMMMDRDAARLPDALLFTLFIMF